MKQKQLSTLLPYCNGCLEDENTLKISVITKTAFPWMDTKSNMFNMSPLVLVLGVFSAGKSLTIQVLATVKEIRILLMYHGFAKNDKNQH